MNRKKKITIIVVILVLFVIAIIMWWQQFKTHSCFVCHCDNNVVATIQD